MVTVPLHKGQVTETSVDVSAREERLSESVHGRGTSDPQSIHCCQLPLAPSTCSTVTHPLKRKRKRDLPETVSRMLTSKRSASSSSTGQLTVKAKAHSFDSVPGNNVAESLVFRRKEQVTSNATQRTRQPLQSDSR